MTALIDVGRLALGAAPYAHRVQVLAIAIACQSTLGSTPVEEPDEQGCPCIADINCDGILDIMDFVAFQNIFKSGDDSADCDDNGVLDVLDFTCFQNLFLGGAGCDVGDLTLIPGDGWDGPTIQPPAVGDPDDPGYDAKAIARWDVVPFQTFDGVFEIGVVAFHLNGIDKVEFSVDGGAWQPVYEINVNPRTGVWEYWASLDASLFSEDGQVEVRAIVWPTIGTPRVLGGLMEEDGNTGEHSLLLSANANGSLQAPVLWVDANSGSDANGDGSEALPFKTVKFALNFLVEASPQYPKDGDGATIFLQPGAYDWGETLDEGILDIWNPNTHDRWATVTTAPGVDRSEVIFDELGEENGGLNVDRHLCVKNVTLDIPLLSISGANFLWIDNCRIYEKTWWSRPWYKGGIYVTGTQAIARPGQTFGNVFTEVTLARNCVADTFNADAFPGARCVINSIVKNQNLIPSEAHSDIFQTRPDSTKNIILYGVTAIDNNRGQGFFSWDDAAKDIAYINNHVHTIAYPQQNQWGPFTNHILVRYNTFTGTPFRVVLDQDDPNDPNAGYAGSTNGAWEHNVFQWVNLSVNAPEALHFDINHFLNVWPDYHENAGQPAPNPPVGTNFTTGEDIPAGVGHYGDAPPPG